MKVSRCKNCNGELIFDPDSAVLVCERCGSTFPVQENKSSQIRREYDSSYIIENNDDGVAYRCATCQAKSVVGYNEVKRCSSCGNTTLIVDKSWFKAPDGIVPFSVSFSTAIRSYAVFLCGLSDFSR